jgi:hypothetical protein
MSQSVKDVPWLKRFFNSVKSVFSLTAGMSIALDARGWPMNSIAAAGKKATYSKTATGALVLLPAALIDRQVLIVATVNETFAQSTGTKSAYDIGETGTTHKFKQTLNSGNANAQTFYDGTLSANKELLITATAATGDGAGGIDVSVVAVPLSS